jgi:hypothetical protein
MLVATTTLGKKLEKKKAFQCENANFATTRSTK